MKGVRRAVSRDIWGLRDLSPGFIGWDKIVYFCSRLNNEIMRTIYATTFLTGGRISEVLQLKKENFRIMEDQIVVERMRLLKRYEKIDEYMEWKKERPRGAFSKLYKFDEGSGKWYRRRYKTKLKIEYRPPFSFPIKEPLVPLLLKRLKEIEEKDLLFPSILYKSIRNYPISRRIVEKYFSKVIIGHDDQGEVHLYPHWLRAQRASCLISFYGMSVEEMMEWFGWSEAKTALMYAKFGVVALGRKMLGKEYPKEALEIQEKLF
jgi:integrase